MPEITSTNLKKNKEKILKTWAERCLNEVASAGTVGALRLRDSIPIYLDNLSQALALNKKMDFRSVFHRDQESVRIGKMHGSDRAESKNYELAEVIFEYHILRETIFEALESSRPLESVQRDIILDSIEQAVNDAAVEFSETHTDIQQKFVNTLTHDLTNPIASIKMNLELILRQSDIKASSAKFARKALVSLNRLQTMIHDLLDVSRIRAGEGLSLSFEECDLQPVMREVIEEMTLIYGNRFILESPEKVKGNWNCDGIRRAVENLIVNAAKYGADEAVIEVSLKYLPTGIEIGVHNEGPPIPEKEIPTFFQYFRRAKSAQEGSKTGWGLGLTLVKGVVDAHKGKVRIDSTQEKGTTFILEIPFREPSKAAA